MANPIKKPTKNPIPVIIIPRIRQFFANFGSSSFRTKYAITPPIILKKIGNKYHHPLLFVCGLFPSLAADRSCSFTSLPQCVQTSASGEGNSFPHPEQNGIRFSCNQWIKLLLAKQVIFSKFKKNL